jgi:hypothetical protein
VWFVGGWGCSIDGEAWGPFEGTIIGWQRGDAPGSRR